MLFHYTGFQRDSWLHRCNYPCLLISPHWSGGSPHLKLWSWGLWRYLSLPHSSTIWFLEGAHPLEVGTGGRFGLLFQHECSEAGFQNASLDLKFTREMEILFLMKNCIQALKVFNTHTSKGKFKINCFLNRLLSLRIHVSIVKCILIKFHKINGNSLLNTLRDFLETKTILHLKTSL